MIVGLTYDLRADWLAAGYTDEQTAEFDREDTLEAIESALRNLGHATERIGRHEALVRRLAELEPVTPGASRATRQPWDLVFNIAEGMFGVGREAQVPCLLDAFGIPYTFSDPLVLSVTLHKAMTKRLVRDLGLPTPAFEVVESPEGFDRVALAGPLFVKPVAEGTSKGVTPRSRAETRSELAREGTALLEAFGQPVLVEEFLPGREVTVGIVGTGRDAKAVGVLEIRIHPGVEGGIYTQALKEDWHGRLEYLLARGALEEEAGALALAVWRGLGCRDGGRVDLKQDRAGRLSFIEVNPLPGLHPEHSDLPILCALAGMSYRELIGAITLSAARRITPSSPR